MFGSFVPSAMHLLFRIPPDGVSGSYCVFWEAVVPQFSQNVIPSSGTGVCLSFPDKDAARGEIKSLSFQSVDKNIRV